MCFLHGNLWERFYVSPFAEIAVFCNPKVRIAHPRISRRSGAERPGYRPTATRVLHATIPSSSGPARIGWGEGRGAGCGWAAWVILYQLPPLHQPGHWTLPAPPPPYPPTPPLPSRIRAGAVYLLLVFRNRSPGGIYPTTVRYPGPDLRCPFRFDAIPAPLGWKKTTSSSLVTRRAPGRSASEGW